MRTLSTVAQALVAQQVMAEVVVVEITVVEDHSVPTLATPVRITTHPTANGAQPGLPYLTRITFPTETISHLPSPVASGIDAAQRTIRAVIANVPYQGGFLFDHLTATGQLDRAHVTLETLLVPPRELGIAQEHQWFLDEAASLGGTVPWFEGEVERVQAIGREIQFTARTLQPVVPWKNVPVTGGDPRDRGTRLPIPLGKGAILRCVNLDVGAVAVIDEFVSIVQDTVTIGFEQSGTLPSSGSAMLGAESISWTGRTGNTLTGVTRAELGTSAAIHVAGTSLIELQPIVLGISSIPDIASVRSLFVKSLTTGTTIKMPDLIYSIDYDDETNSPGDTGDGIVTATLSPSQVAVIVSSVIADAAVVRQAEYADTAPTESTDADDTVPLYNFLVASTSGAIGSWANVTTAPEWTSGTGGTRQEVRTRFPFNLATTGAAQFRKVRFGFDVTIDTLTGTDITIGLRVSGAEAALVGVPDGTIVASRTFTGTGAVTDIWSPEFNSAEGAICGELYDVTIDVAKGEITGGGSAVFTIDDTRIEVTSYTDSATQTIPANERLQMNDAVTVAASSPFWNFDQPVDQGTYDVRVTRDDAEARKVLDMTLLTDSNQFLIDTAGPEFDFGNFSQIEAAGDPTIAFFWDPVGGNSSTSLTVIFEAVGDWSEFGDKPSKVTLTADADVGAGSTPESLSNLINNCRTSDMTGRKFDITIEGGEDGDAVDLRIEIDVVLRTIADPDFALTSRIENSEIEASPGGIGLEFYAICDGPVAPDATYDAASGDLLENPSDLLRYWLQEVGGFAAADVDDTTFDSAVTTLTDYVWGFDVRNLGRDWRSILARMAYEARANVCRPSGADWKMLMADSSFEFPTPTITISDLADVQVIGKDTDELATRLTVYYAHDSRADARDDRSHGEVQTTNPLDAAVIAREEIFGRLDAEPFSLLCHTVDGAAGVTDWREYMEQELGRDGPLVACRVNHWDGYAIEIGDIRFLSDPILGDSSVKVRCIETQRDPQRGIRDRFVKVL